LTERLWESIILRDYSGIKSKGKPVLENCHVLARGAARKQGRSSWHQRLAHGGWLDGALRMAHVGEMTPSLSSPVRRAGRTRPSSEEISEYAEPAAFLLGGTRELT
jgi:hypothetical protein